MTASLIVAIVLLCLCIGMAGAVFILLWTRLSKQERGVQARKKWRAF